MTTHPPTGRYPTGVYEHWCEHGDAESAAIMDAYDANYREIERNAAKWPTVCEHLSASGIDQTDGPDKVWRCDACGWLYRRVHHGDGTSHMEPA